MNVKLAKPQLLQDEKDIKEYYTQTHKKIDLLFKKEKGLLKTKKSLRKPIEPLCFVKRTYGIVDIYEGVIGDTFIIPPGEDPKKTGGVQWGDTDVKAKKKGQKVVYLTNRDLHEIPWGTYRVKGYFVDENDAMPWGSDPRVWSERLEYTIDAILLNFENYKRKNEAGAMDWTWKLAMAVGGSIALYFMVKGLFPGAATAILPGGGNAAAGAIANGAEIANKTGSIVVVG